MDFIFFLDSLEGDIILKYVRSMKYVISEETFFGVRVFYEANFDGGTFFKVCVFYEVEDFDGDTFRFTKYVFCVF